MSYTTLHSVPASGPIQSFATFKNAFLSAFVVWDIIAKEYAGITSISSLMFDKEKMNAFWKLVKDPKLPEFARAVMGSTFDKVMVKREDCKKLAGHMREFDAAFSKHGKTHMLAIADELDKLSETDAAAACFTQTSVSSDVWQVRENKDDEDSEDRYYDISKDNGHWFLYHD